MVISLMEDRRGGGGNARKDLGNYVRSKPCCSKIVFLVSLLIKLLIYCYFTDKYFIFIAMGIVRGQKTQISSQILGGLQRAIIKP